MVKVKLKHHLKKSFQISEEICSTTWAEIPAGRFGMDNGREISLQLNTDEGEEKWADHGSTLDLRGQSLSLETCSALAKNFQEYSTLTEVLLSDCMLHEKGAKALLTGLCGNTTVKVLDLRGNNLMMSCAELLGRFLTHNKTLRRLVLEWNGLGVCNKAFSCFCDGLASNGVLTHLDLRNNQINHQGASELALSIKHSNTLEVLDLRWNNIGLLGGRSLLDALQKNNSIVQLDIAGNNIPSDTLKALEQTIRYNSERNSTLKESCSRSQIFTKEIQIIKEEKGQQLLKLMKTIDGQKEEMEHSNRSTSVQILQLQEALNQKMSAINSLSTKLQMTEAALALSNQKKHNIGELLSRLKAEKEEQIEWQNRDRKKEQEDCALREEKLLRKINNLTEINSQLRNKVEELERKLKSQQQQMFELRQQTTNHTAELKLQVAKAEDCLEEEKRRSRQTLEDMDSLHSKKIKHVSQQLEDSKVALQERVSKLERQRIQLEEELSKTKALEEELGRVRAQWRFEEEHVSSLEENLRSVRSSLQEVQLSSLQQKQNISDLKDKNNQQSTEMDRMRHTIKELQQELLSKDEQKVAEVSRLQVELQDQTGHLEAEKMRQEGLKRHINALETQMKDMTNSHREALLEKDSEMWSILEKLRLKEAEIQRMREDEAHRASNLQNAIFTYIQGSPLGNYSSPSK